MPNSGHKEIIDSVALYGTLGGMGGVAMYLNQIRKGRPFKVGMFFINIFVSGLIGFWVGVSVPSTMGDIQYSIISISGFLAFPILDYLEENGLKLLIKRFLGPSK